MAKRIGLMGRLTVLSRLTMALGAVAFLVAGCGTAAETHQEMLTSGVWNSHQWSLSLSPSGGASGVWCLSVSGAQRDSGQCGFNDPHEPRTGPSAQAGLDDTHELAYGPAPSGTVTVRLTSSDVPAIGRTSSAGGPVTTTTHRLPTWAPSGTWWTAIVPTGYWQPRFYDAAGRELTPTRF